MWLNDPRGTAWSNPQLDTVLSIAYPMVVAVVESTGQHWNISRNRILIDVTSAAREYVFDEDHLVRRPVAVRRVEGTTTSADVTAAMGRITLPLRPLNVAQTSAPYGGYGVERFSATEFLYAYRDSSGAWVLGFEASEPRDQVVEIEYVPTVEDLTSDGQYPVMVPGDFHHVIAMRAAMIAKGSENRDNDSLVLNYRAEEARMIGELSSLFAGGSRRF